MSLTLTCTVGCRSHRASFSPVLCHGISLASISRVRAWVISRIRFWRTRTQQQSDRDQFAIQSDITDSIAIDTPVALVVRKRHHAHQQRRPAATSATSLRAQRALGTNPLAAVRAGKREACDGGRRRVGCLVESRYEAAGFGVEGA